MWSWMAAAGKITAGRACHFTCPGSFRRHRRDDFHFNFAPSQTLTALSYAASSHSAPSYTILRSAADGITLKEMSKAYYYHATLYHFDEEARKTVISRFNDAVNNASAHCWYDDGQEVLDHKHIASFFLSDTARQHFKLTCPVGPLAPEMDDLLAGTVSSYVTEELRNAEQAEVSIIAHQLALDRYEHALNHYHRDSHTSHASPRACSTTLWGPRCPIFSRMRMRMRMSH